jgi:inhibitor of cysteine peptidase
MGTAVSFGTTLTALVLAGRLASVLAQEVVVTEGDDGKTVRMAVGQSLAVNLPGNASTGYAWSLSATNGDSVISTGQATYTAEPGGLPGAGGVFSFPFRAVQTGETALSFAYSRPWDPASVARTFSVRIDVTGEITLPRLSIALLERNVVITWPIADSTGFYLEGTPAICPPRWAALNVLPLPEGPNYKVMLPASGDELFFRLRK